MKKNINAVLIITVFLVTSSLFSRRNSLKTVYIKNRVGINLIAEVNYRKNGISKMRSLLVYTGSEVKIEADIKSRVTVKYLKNGRYFKRSITVLKGRKSVIYMK